MGNKDIRIIVTGDICINLLQWVTYPQNNSGLNWKTHSNVHSILRLGESLLLSELVALAPRVSVSSLIINDIEGVSMKESLRSTAELDRFPKCTQNNLNEKSL